MMFSRLAARRLFLVLVLILVAGSGFAQTVTDPRLLEFTPSTDHFGTSADGLALVTNYTLAIYQAGATVPFEGVDLGKPAPEPDGKIRVAFIGLLNPALTPGVTYEARVTASGPGGSATSVPSNTFAFSLAGPPGLPCPAPAIGEFTGCYYTGKDFATLAVARTDAAVAFDWGAGSPDPAIATDDFSVRWSGVFTFDQAGDYILTDASDDGIRVWIDGALVVDQWIDRAITTDRTTIPLTAGAHTVTVEYYEYGGLASVAVAWTLAAPPAPAPIDCVVTDWTCGAWSAWAPIDGTTEQRTRACTRSIFTAAANGGLACPADLTRTETETRAIAPAGDSTLPIVALAVPKQNGKSKNYALTATATDNVAVVRVELYVDGRWIAPSLTAPTALPSTYTFTAAIASAGLHTITVKAFDAAGNVGAASRTVTR